MAYLLADWLDGVDIHEAVEYVLPLLPDLATDGMLTIAESHNVILTYPTPLEQMNISSRKC